MEGSINSHYIPQLLLRHFCKEGKLNYHNIHTNMLQKEVRERILSENPGFDLSGIDIMINANSGLPTNEDHNYKFYYENFKRVLDKHIKKYTTI